MPVIRVKMVLSVLMTSTDSPVHVLLASLVNFVTRVGELMSAFDANIRPEFENNLMFLNPNPY